ncbi:MAG: hypothetical protein WBB85_04575 [Albidovulum sp.]|uniref:hypothetical protein n=1 Tax=Albidovulum sp. TaxID=1872424 RepID=UPI003C9532AF
MMDSNSGWWLDVALPDSGDAVLLKAELYRALCRSLGVDRLEELGCGDDAVVYALPGQKLAARIAISSAPFSRFVDLSNRQGSRHLPRVVHHADNGHLSLTIMEHLEPAPDPADIAFWADANAAAALAYTRLDERPCSDGPHKPGLYEIAALLGDLAREQNYALDLNRNNILRRGGGDVVFSDVWCGWGE